MKNKQKSLLIGIIFILILIFFILFVKFFPEKEDAEEKEKKFCDEESRNADVCITIYEPVCGYYTLNDCSDFTCKKTFSNSCFACIDKNVLFYVKGEC